MAAEDPSVSGVSGRYATALFELARDEKSVDAVKADLDRFDAMLAPMMPRPMNPTFIAISYFLASKTWVAMRAAVMAVGQPA